MAVAKRVTEAEYRGKYSSNIGAGASADADAMRDMAAAADQASDAQDKLAQGMTTTDQVVKRAGPTMEAISRRYDEQARQAALVERADRALASTKETVRQHVIRGAIDEQQAAEIIRRATQDRDNSVLRAQKIAEGMRATYAANTQAAIAAAAANDNAGRGAGKFSQILGQAGLQAQDLAVQLNNGTSAITALGQQLPQFLGAFGPGGAIAGAVVALAALVANIATAGDKAALATGEVSILDSAMRALTGGADEQKESMEKLALAYDKVTGARQDLLRIELQQRIADEAKAIKAQQQALDDIISRIGRGIDVSLAGAGTYQRDLMALRELRTLADRAEYGPLIEQLQQAGGVAGELAGQALTASRAILNLRDSSNQAKEFLANLTGGMLNLNASATEVAGNATDLGSAMLEAFGKQLSDAMQRHTRLVEESRRVTEAYFDPFEKYNARVRELSGLYLSAETRARALAAAQADLAGSFAGVMKVDMPAIDNSDFTAALSAQVESLWGGGIAREAEAAGERMIARAQQAVADTFAGESKQFSQLAQQAITDGGLDASAIMRAAIASAMGESLEDFYKDLRDTLEGVMPGLGDTIKNAFASAATAQGVAKMLGLGEERSRNAGIGAGVGSVAGKFLPGGSKVWSTIGAVIGSAFKGNSAEDAYWQQRSQDLDMLATSISSFMAKTNGMSDLARQFADLEKEYTALRVEAVRLGQPIEDLTSAYQKQRAALTKAFGDDVQSVIDRLTGNQAQADLRALTKAQDQRVQDALVAEYDLAQVRRANALELAEFFGTLTEQQLATMGSLVTAVDRVKARIRDLTSTVNDQLDTQIDLAQTLADSARTQAKALRDLATSLRDQVKSNLTGDLSPLSPGEKYSALSVEFDRLYGLAMGGDQVSAEKIAQAGTDLLQAAKAMYATGPDYVSTFQRVQDALTKVAAVTDIRATAMDRIADAAGVQVEILKAIKAVLASDLGQPTAQAIAAAIADGVLTVDEISGINLTLDNLYKQFANLPGASAQAVKLAIEAIRPELVAGTLTDAQKTALTTGQGAIADALTAFRVDQLAQYRDALIAAGDVIAKLSDFVLDPDGKIPSAVESAFKSTNVQQALSAGVESLFKTALGGNWTALTLTARTDQTFGDALGAWTASNLATRIEGQFGDAIANWATAGDTRTLVQRVDDVFNQAVGAADWDVTLKSLMDQQSPLVTSLTALTAQFPALIAAMQKQAASDAAAAAYDTGMQAYVSPVLRAASTASTTLSGAKAVEAGKSMSSTWYQVDASTGAITAQGGKDSDSTSDARAKALASSLSTIASQIEALTGGDVTDFAVNAGNKYGSGYNFLQYGIDKAQSYGINDFAGIARGFISDVLSTALQGGNASAIDILKAQDWSNLSTSFSAAAQQIYALTHPKPMAMGGLVTGGVPGMDSVHLLAMQGERVLNVPQSAMLETIYRHTAGRGEGKAVSDPAQLAELRALREEMAASRADRAQQARVNAELTTRLVKSNEEMMRLSKQEKAGGR